jgi:AcrR family transcriptional regulator
MSESVSTRWPARSAAKAATRAALIEAAREIGTERGYNATSVEAVAERAGVTTGSIYSIFGGKRQLFQAAFNEVNQLPALADVATPGTPMLEVLDAFGRRWAEVSARPMTQTSYDLALELRVATRGDKVAAAEEQESYKLHIQAIAKELTAFASASGESLPMPANDLARCLAGALAGLAYARVRTGAPDVKYFGYLAASLWSGPAT